jgi:hypothetical protein
MMMGNLREPPEDYIDFTCSDTFRGFFYERGLTPHPPRSITTDNRVAALETQINTLMNQVDELMGYIAEKPVRASQVNNRPPQTSSPPARPPGPITSPTRRPIWTDSQ